MSTGNWGNAYGAVAASQAAQARRQAAWGGKSPSISQPIDPNPLRLPILPQWGVKTAIHFPRPWALSKGHYYGVPFTFGSIASPLAARATEQVNVQFPFNVQAWGWTAHSTDITGPGGSASPYDVLIVHTTMEGTQRPWTASRVGNANLFGTSQFANWFRVPQIILAGESLQMEISSGAAVAVNQIQAVLHCTVVVE